MSVYRCPHCHSPVQWMSTKFNRRMLFDATPAPVDDVDEEVGWMPGRWPVGSTKRTVMAPLRHYSRDKRERVKHVATLHKCVQYLAARRVMRSLHQLAEPGGP